MGRAPKGNNRFPTIHFQVRTECVCFEGNCLLLLMAEILHHLLSMKPYGKNGIFSKSQPVSLPEFWLPSTPIGSMYGIFRPTFVEKFLLVNVVMAPYGTSYGYRLQRFQPLAVFTLQISVGTLALAAEALVGFLPWRRGGSVLGNCEKTTQLENQKYQDYTWKCTIYIYDIVTSCVCVHMTGKSG